MWLQLAHFHFDHDIHVTATSQLRNVSQHFSCKSDNNYIHRLTHVLSTTNAHCKRIIDNKCTLHTYYRQQMHTANTERVEV